MPERRIISLVKEITTDGSTKDWILLSAIQFNEPYPTKIKSFDLSMVQQGFNVGGSTVLYVERHDVGNSANLRFAEDRRLLTLGPGVWYVPHNFNPSSSLVLTCNVYKPHNRIDVDLSMQSNDVLLVAGSVNLSSAPAASLILVVSVLIQYEILNPFLRR